MTDNKTDGTIISEECENNFDEMLDTGDEIILESKNVYKFRSQVVNFDYKFVLNITDFSLVYEDMEAGKEYGACLVLVPMPEYVKRNMLKMVVNDVCGTIDNYDVEMMHVSARDLDECGFSIVISKIPTGFTEEGDFEGFSFEAIPKVIKTVSDTLSTIETNLDALLKKSQNRCGESGWKSLLQMLNNEIHDDSML